MRRTYLDTSALRHLLVAHPHTADVAARLMDADTITATSQIAVTELHRLALREPQLTVPDVDAVLDRVDLVALSTTQLRSAGLLPNLRSGAQLRGLDAIHIQASLDFNATEFLTSDNKQADAADLLGLPARLLTTTR